VDKKNVNHLIENNECFKVDQVFRVQPNTKKCCFIYFKKNYVAIFNNLCRQKKIVNENCLQSQRKIRGLR
jgi:hypothetical protein